MIYKKAAGKRVTVPYHAAKILHPKLLKSILRDADLTPENLAELLLIWLRGTWKRERQDDRGLSPFASRQASCDASCRAGQWAWPREFKRH